MSREFLSLLVIVFVPSTQCRLGILLSLFISQVSGLSRETTSELGVLLRGIIIKEGVRLPLDGGVEHVGHVHFL